MKRKLFMVLFIMAIVVSMVPQTASAKATPPTALGAPVHPGVGLHFNDYCFFSFGASEELRTYIEARAKEDPDNNQTYPAHFQIDYRLDNGNWHYTREWDTPDYIASTDNMNYLTFISGKKYMSDDSWNLSQLFPDNSDLSEFQENGPDYLKDHSITFRVRFVESFDDDETYVFSNWSEEFTLSSKMTVDPDKLIDHAPILKSVDMITDSYGYRYFVIKTGRVPGEIQDLLSMTENAVMTEVWMRKKGETEFQHIHSDWAYSEYYEVLASLLNDDEDSYEIKLRFSLSLNNYEQSGRSDTIYSPFSNVVSHNMSSWSKASQWAALELEKAVGNSLYPDRLKGADLTKPITRAEFAAVALKLYEALSGKTAAPAPASTFTDTKDTDVLKAYALDIVAGVGGNKFAPDDYVNREQAATMLTRVYKKLNWEGWTLAGDSAYTKHSLDNKGVPPFADDALISSWAKPSVYFMAKYEIIKGLGGNKFAPKNTTATEITAGYANATREQALAISNRTFEKLDTIQDGGAVSAVPTQAAQPTKAPTPTAQPTKAPTPTVDEKDMNKWIVGFWGYSDSAGPGTFDGRVYVDNMIEFKSDGTFYKIVSSMWRGARTATAFKGKYRISGNKLILSEQLKSTGGIMKH